MLFPLLDGHVGRSAILGGSGVIAALFRRSGLGFDRFGRKLEWDRFSIHYTPRLRIIDEIHQRAMLC